MFSTAKSVSKAPHDCGAEEFYQIVNDKDGLLLSLCRNVQMHKELAEKHRAIIAQTEDPTLIEYHTQEMHKALDAAAMQKKKLPIFCFQATFADGRRTNATARPNGLVMVDIDGIDDPEKEYQRLLTADSATMVGLVVLVYVTPSGHGLRIVFKGQEGMGYVENQHWFAERFGLSIDEACKDLARCSFAVPKSYIKFISESIFTYDNGKIFSNFQQEAHRQSAPAASRRADSGVRANPTDESAAPNAGSTAGCQSEGNSQTVENSIINLLETNENGEKCYRGIPFHLIIERFFECIGGKPVIGERNTKLHRLAINLRYLLDNDASAVASLIQPYSEGLSEAEVLAICRSACSNNQQPIVPRTLQRVISEFRKKIGNDEAASVASPGGGEEGIDYDRWNAEIDKLQYPPALAASLAGVPEEVRMGALLVTLPLLYTLLSRIAFKFYDGSWYRMSGQTYIVGDAASGKSFMTQLSTLWLAPISAADKVGREQLRKWKQLKVQKGQNKMDTPKPTPCIRIVPTQASIATILERMFYAVEKDVQSLDGLTTFNRHLHIVTVETEIATLIRMLRSNFAQFLDIMVKAFQDEKVGVDYQNADSINAIFNAHWNVVFGGTWTSFWQLCRDVLNGHPLRMMIFPMPDMRFEMLAKGGNSRSVSQMSCIKETAFKLTNPRIQGNVICKNLNNEMWRWCDEEAELAKEQNDTIRDIVRRRAALIGLRAGLAFAIMENIDTFASIQPEASKENEWFRPLTASKDALRFARMIASFCAEVQYKVFAKPMLEKMNEVARVGSVRSKTPVADSFYESLPDVFKAKEVNKNNDKTMRTRLSRLVKAGKLTYDLRTHTYRKQKKQ